MRPALRRRSGKRKSEWPPRFKYRMLTPEQWLAEIVLRRDRAILTIRDVRKNMIRRMSAAKKVQHCLTNGRQSRFSDNDVVDARLRTEFVELLEQAPTSILLDYFGGAVEARNMVCTELIRFEFQCRVDRHEYTSRFEKIVERMESYYTMDLRRRISNICNAVQRVDLGIMALLEQATEHKEQINQVHEATVLTKNELGTHVPQCRLLESTGRCKIIIAAPAAADMNGTSFNSSG
jgi:hypothetical protein